MDRKGEINTAVVLTGFIGILVALILLQGIYPYIGTATNTVTMVNQTFTTPAAGSTVDLVGQEILSTPIVINRSSGTVVPSTNYTIGERVSPVDGLKRVYYKSEGGVFNSVGVNISYTYGPEGYIEDASGRSVAGLIAIMAALAVVVFTIGMVLKEKFF